MEFRILGPLEVVENGHMLDLGGQKQRALLAMLLLNANEVVSLDRLIDALWPERPPETAGKALQVYVSQLRKALGRERLQTKSPGYLLQVGDGELDVVRCGKFLEDGRPEDALALWRGPALSEFAYEPFAQSDIARLEELRLACLEERVEADLAAGRHGALTGELENLVADHPLRERFRGQRMLALYRSGRQAEALDAYQEGRRLLGDELGLEPSETLKNLQRAILAHDPALELATVSEEEPSLDLAPPAVPAALELREARKTVTVLFAALGTDESMASLDPEAQRRLAADALAEIVAAVERHGGTVETFSGDALTAVFGVPVVHEDDALRALRAAAELHERLRETSVARSAHLDVHLGLSTGEVITGGPEAGLRSTGRPVTVAARLGRAAAPGDLLLDEATYRRVQEAVDVEPGDDALRFVALQPDTDTGRRRFEAPMVGRGRERRRLHDAFEQAIGDSSCQLFTILGAAGVGKSRLVREFLDELDPDVQVVRGRCLPYGQGITYFPLMEAVKDAAGLDDTDSPEDGLAKIAALLDDDANPVARRVGELVGLAEVGIGVPESFAAVRALFESIARRGPLVAVFDDIHWGEATFLDLVEHLAESIRETPVLIVCVARPELLDVRSGWSGGKVNATSVLLEPLSEHESSQLLEHLAGPDELTPATRARIVGAAEGNPLFVEEMLALVLEDGEQDGELLVPPTIQALLAARLDRLDERERLVVEHAAVQGKEFYAAALAELVPEPLRPGAGDVLASLARKELVRTGRGGLGGKTYRFRHLLIRDAAYDSIPKQARAGLHEAFAEWLEHTSGERSTEYEEVVGYHYEQACRYRAELGPVNDAAREVGRRAAERLGAAGRRALMRSDAPAGSNLISRAVALLRRDDPLRVELIPNVRKIQGLTGDLSWADRVLTEAVEAASTTGDRSLAAHALVQRAFLRLFTAAGATPDELLDIAGRAVAVFEEPGDELGLSRAWRLAAQAHYLDRHAAACVDASERALVHARRSGDDLEVREVVEWLIVAYEFGPAPLPDGIERLERLLIEIGANALLEALIGSAIALFETMRGHRELAEQIFARGRLMIEEQTELIPLLLWNSGLARAAAGESIDLAEADLREGYETLEAMGRTGHYSAFCALLAQLSYEQGRYEEAAAYVREAAAGSRANDVHDQVSWRATQAKLLARAGELSEAEELARESVVLAADGDFLFSHAEALLGLGTVLQLAGRPNDAAGPLEDAARLYERKGNVVAAAQVREQLEAL